MDETSKRYRRDLLTAAICDGDLRELITEGLEHYGATLVAIVACTRTDPGRTFLRAIAKCAGDNVRWQRGVRESLAVHRAVNIVVPSDCFLPLADHVADTLGQSIRDLLSRPGVVPVVVMGGNATMTAGAAAVGPDGTLPQSLADCNGRMWAVTRPSDSPASRERQRSTDRDRRHGMN
jgi:hypothetical protein